MNGFAPTRQALILRDHALMQAYSCMMAERLIDDALYRRRIPEYKLQPMSGDEFAIQRPTGD
ncbi:hypothetical protein ACVSQB_33910 [Bradyrhizobium elkanii]